MTPADLIQIVRQDFLDDVSDAVDGPDSDATWSNEFLLRQVGEAQRQACYRQDLRHLFDDTTEAICEITLASGTQSYALDSRILRIHDAQYGGEAVVHTTQDALDRAFHDWRTLTGAPEQFFIRGRMLTLDRIPGTAEDGETLALSVWREPLATPGMNDDLEWTLDPEKLGHWVAHRAFMRPNLSKEAPGLSKQHRDLFDLAFGREVPAAARAELLAYPDRVGLGPVTVRNHRWAFQCEDFDTGG